VKHALIAALLFAALKTGDVAPDFKLVDQNGRTQTLASARGHKAVLVFYRGYW
jgi:peroxiredoxin